MNRNEREYKIRAILSQRRATSFAHLLSVLEVSPATLKRDLRHMREGMNSPIDWSRDAGGYRLGAAYRPGDPSHELPGMWFSPAEIHALLTMHQLLMRLDGGALLGPHVAPLMERLNALLAATAQADGQSDKAPGLDKSARAQAAQAASVASAAEQVRRRVRIIGLARRHSQSEHFQIVGSALLQRKRLDIRYKARGTGETTQREVSPLRLVHYRENWHLDAWCHLRKGLRNFSVDAIQAARLLGKPAREVADEKLDATFGPSYGIFSGGRLRWARLRFTPERAVWVKDEHWHSEQQGTLLDDGGFELRIPYSDHRELLMDVLKHGTHCEVLAPASLRKLVREEVAAMAEKYLRD